MVVCNVRRLDQNRSMPTRQAGSLGHVGMKNPQPFLTRGFLALYNWRCNLLLCICGYTVSNIPHFHCEHTTRQPDTLRVVWSCLRLIVKKAAKIVLPRVDNGPTPDRHDQHVYAWERQVPASNGYAGKVGLLCLEAKYVRNIG